MNADATFTRQNWGTGFYVNPHRRERPGRKATMEDLPRITMLRAAGHYSEDIAIMLGLDFESVRGMA